MRCNSVGQAIKKYIDMFKINSESTSYNIMSGTLVELPTDWVNSADSNYSEENCTYMQDSAV